MNPVQARTDPTFVPGGDGVVVSRPRPTDAIGKALRQAFVTDQRMPGELAHTLDALNIGR